MKLAFKHQYVSSLNMHDPIHFLVMILPEQLTKEGDPPVNTCNENLFRRFLADFNSVLILAEPDRQTVTLSQYVPLDIKCATYKKLLPDEYNNTQLSGNYSCRRSDDNGFQKEEMFFEFRNGYFPSSFFALQSILGCLNFVSAMTNSLDSFRLTIRAEGVHVELTTNTDKFFRPRIEMKRKFS